MRVLDVKNTILSRILRTVAPHYCCSCGKIGAILCDYCIYDIAQEPISACLLCRAPIVSNRACRACAPPYRYSWCASERSRGLREALDQYKFYRAIEGAEVFASLLDATIGELPADVVIVPVPTSRAHVRQRGYDHTYELARQFAQRKRRPLAAMLGRNHNHRQLGASRSQRSAQAKTAFTCTATPDERTIYLLVDDIATTGATMRHAAQTLRDAGAAEVWCLVLAMQPLDEQREIC